MLPIKSHTNSRRLCMSSEPNGPLAMPTDRSEDVSETEAKLAELGHGRPLIPRRHLANLSIPVGRRAAVGDRQRFHKVH